MTHKMVDIIIDGSYYGSVIEQLKHTYLLDLIKTLSLIPYKIEYNDKQNVEVK